MSHLGGGSIVFASAARWAFWTLPGRVRALVLVVEAAAAVLVLVALAGPLPEPDELVLGCCLLGLGMLHVEAATGIARARRR